MQLIDQVRALHQTVSARCLHHEVMLADLVSLTVGVYSTGELKELLQRAIDDRFMDVVRTDAGMVVTFANLQTVVEVVSIDDVLSEVANLAS